MRRLTGLPSFSMPAICAALLLSSLGGLSGCQLLDSTAAKNGVVNNATLRLQGIAQPSYIARNAAGMPLLEASNAHDLLFTFGYSHASDRLAQMLQLRLLAQGRLAELHGAELLNLDRLMRSIDLPATAHALYQQAPKKLQTYFEIYARGVNAYLYHMRDALPPTLAQADYKPDYWRAEDSALLFSLFSFSQSGNLSEEVLALAFAQHLDSEKLPWLLPVYPDEPLALHETAKLQALPRSVIHNNALRDSTLHLLDALNQFSAFNSLQAPLASSWATHPQHNTKRRSILALNTLQSASTITNTLSPSNTPPSLYSWINLYSPQLHVAGLTIPGVPLLISGFNGQLAYSISAVMADTQDIFIEKLRQHNGRLEYFADKKWQPAQQRMETFFIRGQNPVRETLYSTAHGPLLTSLPTQASSGYGLALQHVRLSEDRSLNALWQLLSSKTVEQATPIVHDLRSLPANVLLADAEHIAWQVTGTYPNRRNSRGLFPSADWNASVAWEGFADPMLYPYDQDPPQGWLSAANQRLTPPSYGMQLSSSWASPERAENLAKQLTKKSAATNFAMHNSEYWRPWLVTQLQQMLNSGGMPQALQHSIRKLPSAQRATAEQALHNVLAINPLQPLSKEQVAWLTGFLAQAQAQLFNTEVQVLPASVQQAFVQQNRHSYPAWLDHVLGREDSPFWQTVAESKAQFLVDNLLSNQQALSQTVPKTHISNNQLMLVDFSRPIPLSAASFSGQTDNPNHTYYRLKSAVAGTLYPIPLNNKDIDAAYGKQRVSLLPMH